MSHLYAKSVNPDGSSALVGWHSLSDRPTTTEIDSAARELTAACGFRGDTSASFLELYDGDVLVRDLPADAYRPEPRQPRGHAFTTCQSYRDLDSVAE